MSSPVMDVAAGTAVLDAVSAALLIGGGCVALAAASVVLAVAVTVRRIRRSPALAAANLRWQALTAPGPRREVARLRLALFKAVDGGRIAIGAADAQAGLPGEAPALFRRIQAEARVVDQQLRVLQGEEDPATLGAALPPVRRRVSELIGMVRDLRSAVAAGLAAVADGAMAELGADVEREVVALRAGRERLRSLDAPVPRADWTGKGAIR